MTNSNSPAPLTKEELIRACRSASERIYLLNLTARALCPEIGRLGYTSDIANDLLRCQNLCSEYIRLELSNIDIWSKEIETKYGITQDEIFGNDSKVEKQEV